MRKALSIGFLSLLVVLPLAFSAAPAMAAGEGAPAGDGRLELDGGEGGLYLLQPFDDNKELDAEPGIDIFFTYFNSAWPWLVGTAAGVAVLQAVVGGVQIMMSSGGAGKAAGVERLQWAIAGLVMLVLAGLILRTLNPIFYK
jgi:hypothetical protein